MSVRAYSQQVREEEWEVGMVGVGGELFLHFHLLNFLLMCLKTAE